MTTTTRVRFAEVYTQELLVDGTASVTVEELTSDGSTTIAEVGSVPVDETGVPDLPAAARMLADAGYPVVSGWEAGPTGYTNGVTSL